MAKPNAPEGLVEQVKNGDITTHKEYQDLLAQIKAEKDRADTAEAERDKLLGAQNRAAWAESHIQDVEAQRDAALADVQGLTEQNAKLQQSYHDADESRIAANLQRQKAEAERDRAEQRAKTAEEALKKQPIAAVVDEEEMDRRAHQQAYAIAADMTGELRQKLERMQENDAAWVFQSKDRMESEWERMVPMQERMDPDIKKAALDGVLKMLGRIQGQAFALYPEEEEAGHEVPGAH